MCVNPLKPLFNMFKPPKPPKPLLPPPDIKAPEVEEIKDPEKLIEEEDGKQKVKTSSKKSSILQMKKGSPASKFTSPIPGGTKKSGGLNV